MFTRTRDWWQVRRLRQRPGKPPGNAVVIELDDGEQAYALYRHEFGMRHMVSETKLEVSEALGTSPEALDAVWRYLLAIDWVARIDAYWLPLDHPLFHWIREPRRMACHVIEGLWVRLVDVDAALAAPRPRRGLARARGSGRVLRLERGDAGRSKPARSRARRQRPTCGSTSPRSAPPIWAASRSRASR